MNAVISSYFFRKPEVWPPSIRDTRRTSWTELFYDLVFAAVISQAGSPLSTNYTLEGIASYVILLTLVFLTWLGYTIFSTQFACEDLFQRALIVAQIFLIAVMAANANGSIGSRDAAGFAAAYGAARGILALQYWRVIGLSVCRSSVRRRIIGLTAAAILWAASAFLHTPQRYVAWAVALSIDAINSWSPTSETLRLPPGAIHFPERFGLLTIILLGEFVASVMRGIESQSTWSLPAASAAILSMAFGFAVWSCYSDGAAGWEQRDLHSARDVMRQRAWILLHLLLFLSIGAVGVGARHAIALGGQASFNSLQGWILCSAAAIMMLAIIGIAATTSTNSPRRSVRWPWLVGLFVVCLTFLLGYFASRISATFVVMILFLIVVTETALLTLAHGMDARAGTDLEA